MRSIYCLDDKCPPPCKEGYKWLETVVEEACREVGGIKPEELTGFLKQNLQTRKVLQLEVRIKDLQKKVEDLKIGIRE